MAIDFYLKVDGIEGESQKDGHEKEIELHSWSISGHNSGSFAQNTGGGTGKFSASDLNVSMPVSKASSKLLQACAKGSHIDSAVLSCRKSGGDSKPYDYLKIKLEHCLVASFQESGSSGEEAPSEAVALNFAKITFEYFAQDTSKGTVASTGSVSHDLSKAVTA